MEASFEPTLSYSKLKPDDCVICLRVIQPSRKAKIYGCLHAFCFECIKEWAKKIRSYCPICDQEFSYVLHNLREDGHNDENNFPGDFYLVEYAHVNVLNDDDEEAENDNRIQSNDNEETVHSKDDRALSDDDDDESKESSRNISDRELDEFWDNFGDLSKNSALSDSENKKSDRKSYQQNCKKKDSIGDGDGKRSEEDKKDDSEDDEDDEKDDDDDNDDESDDSDDSGNKNVEATMNVKRKADDDDDEMNELTKKFGRFEFTE
ncbi:hypothetical protein HELRODRAFT_163538 [Helobdella robusta]|uniref:RING-type E3 ubiquitin transferase n=1 Tax=Helobdella robusta TaxID=6412 RepID=T1EU61_HELRO|nr:hypothetical protein HELRODRAFT_163538 [Helobdella robusta]ESN96471.1 hypothetical protein HELRODRAFT_163538 [Helobdella robusta]